jgi:hypothetical protein
VERGGWLPTAVLLRASSYSFLVPWHRHSWPGIPALRCGLLPRPALPQSYFLWLAPHPPIHPPPPIPHPTPLRRACHLLRKHALLPFAAPAGLHACCRCVFAFAAHCAALEASHGLPLLPTLLRELWPPLEQVRRLGCWVAPPFQPALAVVCSTTQHVPHLAALASPLPLDHRPHAALRASPPRLPAHNPPPPPTHTQPMHRCWPGTCASWGRLCGGRWLPKWMRWRRGRRRRPLTWRRGRAWLQVGPPRELAVHALPPAPPASSPRERRQPRRPACRPAWSLPALLPSRLLSLFRCCDEVQLSALCCPRIHHAAFVTIQPACLSTQHFAPPPPPPLRSLPFSRIPAGRAGGGSGGVCAAGVAAGGGRAAPRRRRPLPALHRLAGGSAQCGAQGAGGDG